ncbi:MAG: tetratricopeptide repeat protein, partial [Thermodesulfobacteriota bacterium]
MIRLKAVISILFILSGCAVLQKKEISQEIDIPVPESIVAEVDTQLYQEEKSKIMTLFDEALKQMEDDPNDAIRLYKEAIQVAPNRWEPYYNSGIMYMKLNAPDNAIEKFMIAFKYRAPPAKIYDALGAVYLSMEEKITAIKILERALVYKESPDTMINIANIYQSMGQTKKAIEYYSKAETLNPSNQNIHYNMGILLYNMGD